MRSAETSGVGAKGFGMLHGRLAPLRDAAFRLSAPLRRVAAELSPVTLAVGATAIIAAGLSVVGDVARTLEERRSRSDLVSMISATPGSEWAFPINEDDPVTGIVLRGAGAFGAALLAFGLCFRRRRDSTDAPDLAPCRQHDELLAAIPFGVACWNAGGELVDCNEEYRQRLGTHQDVPVFSYGDAVERLVNGGQMRVVSEDEGNRILELHRADGCCLRIDERPLAGGGFVTLVTDVTERRRADGMLAAIREEQRQLARRYHEEKLRAEAASRSKTSFLAHLSHDIRTPLNHIIGFAEIMRQQAYGPLGDPRYADYAEAMKDSGERLLDFFASILELAELESGRKPLVVEPLLVDELLRGVMRRFIGQARQARVTLALGAPCGAELSGDRFSLERMLGNLIDNAVRFTPAGGRITLAAFAASDGVVVEVTDTGIGMDAEQLALLAQPFALGDSAFTRDHRGAGLGIAIARAIAELSGGRLAIDSRPALGTTVAISLPARLAEPSAAAA